MRKIRLFCAADMSTGMLAARMQEYAKENDYDCNAAVMPVFSNINCTKWHALQAMRFKVDRLQEVPLLKCPSRMLKSAGRCNPGT